MALRLITLVDAGKILALDEKTIRRYISAGRLTGYRIGPRALRVDRMQVEALARPIPSAGGVLAASTGNPAA